MEEQWAFLQDVAVLIQYIRDVGHKAVGGELMRSREEQQRKFDTGVSKAKPGESMHQFLRAIDVEFFEPDGTWMKVPTNKEAQKEMKAKLQIYGDFWETLDKKNRWGGNFRSLFDPNHFERGNSERS